MVVLNWCIQDPIVLYSFDFSSRYPGYEEVLASVYGVLFAVASVNNVLQVNYIFFNGIFYGMILWMVHIDESFIVCFQKSFSSLFIFLLRV